MTNPPNPIDRASLRERSARPAQIAVELKAELLGIDATIDRVIESMRAWYVLPQIIRRPVIICHWGLTGTGKTQLTRRLAQKSLIDIKKALNKRFRPEQVARLGNTHIIYPSLNQAT
jgi:ATP-dependent Clp protease ATP-binding subunit ClpA